MPESTKGRRVRVNVATTSKGVPSFDITYEVWASERAGSDLITEAILGADTLYVTLDAKYGGQQDKPRPELPASAALDGLQELAGKRKAATMQETLAAYRKELEKA